MSTEHSLGKLTNCETKKVLNFSINPTEFTINRAFEFNVEPRLGQPAPLVAYKCGGATQLAFELVFDRDADPECDIKKVSEFLADLNKVHKETRSVAPVEFAMGSFVFKGYVATYTLQALRFDEQGEPTSLRLSLGLLSNGEHEEKGAK